MKGKRGQWEWGQIIGAVIAFLVIIAIVVLIFNVGGLRDKIFGSVQSEDTDSFRRNCNNYILTKDADTYFCKIVNVKIGDKPEMMSCETARRDNKVSDLPALEGGFKLSVKCAPYICKNSNGYGIVADKCSGSYPVKLESKRFWFNSTTRLLEPIPYKKLCCVAKTAPNPQVKCWTPDAAEIDCIEETTSSSDCNTASKKYFDRETCEKILAEA